MRAIGTSFIVAVAVVSLSAQEPPQQYGNVTVEGCGHVGALINEGRGTGTSAGRTTHYATAAFDVACENHVVGQLDLQTADNEPSIVSYRMEKGAAQVETLTGSDTGALVEQAIRLVCSCSTP